MLTLILFKEGDNYFLCVYVCMYVCVCVCEYSKINNIHIKQCKNISSNII